MRLNSITLQNYRNFEVYTLSLGKFVTVLIGRNGMGKTNLLDAMVHSLSFIFSKQRDTEQYEFIKSTNQGVKRFAGDDPRFVKDEYYKYPISISQHITLIFHILVQHTYFCKRRGAFAPLPFFIPFLPTHPSHLLLYPLTDTP